MIATMADAHREWHRNAGVPMGAPGCPQDACHVDEYYEPWPTASAKEIQYLVDLSKTKTPHVAEADIRAWAFKVDRSEVSEKIDWLKGLPVVAPLG